MEWVALGVCVLLIGACAAFGAAEYSLVAVDRTHIEREAEAGNRRAAGVRRALSHLSTQLSGAQIGITTTNLGLGFLAEPALAHVLRSPLRGVGLGDGAIEAIAPAIALALATVITMVFAELVPKKYAIAVPDIAAELTQGFLRGFTWVCRPAIWALNGSANAVVRSFGVEPQEELRSARTLEELSAVAGHSASEGVLDEETAALVQRSVAFGPRTAGEIMTPRMRMATVEQKASVNDVLALSAATGFSKFPVIKGNSDNVVGAIHVKRAVAVPRSERDSTRVREVMAAPTVVPESLKLDPLLALLREEGFQMAIVSDEYGGTAGLVTLEDVVEEIVGDIADEHDVRAPRMRQRPDGSWIVSGLLRPDEVEDATGLTLPEDDAYDTVAGLLVRRLGRVARRGDEIRVELDDPAPDDQTAKRVALLRVELMDGLRVDRISIRVLEDAA